MHQTHPLPDTHPEFTVIHHSGFTEYRVENWRLARDGSGRVIRGTVAWSWFDACLLAVIAVVWKKLQAHDTTSTAIIIGITLVLVFFTWTRCTQVLHESLLVFPTLGIQLETHRGHPSLPHPLITTTTSRHFIHLSTLEDVLIHEGFHRWNVRYYLAAIQRTSSRTEGVRIHVGFENILPYFPVLREVYLGVQETLFSSSPSEAQLGNANGEVPVQKGDTNQDTLYPFLVYSTDS